MFEKFGTNLKIDFNESTQSEHGISFVRLGSNNKNDPVSLNNVVQIEIISCQSNRLPY